MLESVGQDLDPCEADHGITDELFNAELVVEEPCDESNHEGTEEEESSDDDLSGCAGPEEGPALSSADSKTATTSFPRDVRRSCKARLGPVRMRTCRVGQIETRVVDFFFPEDGRTSAPTTVDDAVAAAALADAASAASTPATLERKWPLYYKALAPSPSISNVLKSTFRSLMC